MIKFENENDRELWAAHMTEHYFLIMIGEGFDPLQCHRHITGAWLRYQHAAAIEARRNALRVVDDVPPGTKRTRRRKKGTTGGLRVIDGEALPKG
jgi:hypothetical protein